MEVRTKWSQRILDVLPIGNCGLLSWLKLFVGKWLPVNFEDSSSRLDQKHSSFWQISGCCAVGEIFWILDPHLLVNTEVNSCFLLFWRNLDLFHCCHNNATFLSAALKFVEKGTQTVVIISLFLSALSLRFFHDNTEAN